MMRNKLNRQYSVANLLIHSAGSAETDVLDLPASVPLMLAANFTGDSILASPNMQMRSSLVTICSVLAKTNKCRHQSSIK